MSNDKVVILPNSDEAARITTLTGWISRQGRFYGDSEDFARWDGCTHVVCECGNIHEKTYMKCAECRKKIADEQYAAMPYKEWDRVTPLVLFGDDTYFFSEDDVLYYCDGNNIEPTDLKLVICEPDYPHEIDLDDVYADKLPEDFSVSDLFPELAKAIETVNKLIRENKTPLSWCAGKYRTRWAKARQGTVGAL